VAQSYSGSQILLNGKDQQVLILTCTPTARVLASQAEAIVRTGKHGHNIE